MEFNIGDVVRIRQDLNMEILYENLCVVDPMIAMCRENREWIISDKFTWSGDKYVYELSGQEDYDGGDFAWTAAMLEPAGNEMEISQSELADFLGI